MTSIKYPMIGGRVVRGTRLDSCGVPAWGDRAQVTSDGIVSVEVTANYDDGEEVTVTNFAGRRCVSRDAEPELINLALAVTFCMVDPDFYTLLTGFPAEYDPITGDVIGFRINRGIRPGDIRSALELWSSAQDSSADCDPTGALPYGYLAWPFLSGGRVGDYTIEANNAVTFAVNSMLTKDGSGWGVGPYNVQTDENGDPSPLLTPVDSLDHQIGFRTFQPPPEPSIGLVPLDDPDEGDATGATAGTPGFFTPAGDVRPFDLAALQAAAVTASPSSAWAVNQRVVLGDGTEAHWNGTAWVAGRA